MVYSQWGKTVYDIFVEPDFTHGLIGIDRSVCIDSDWRSATRYEIESDHRTGVNFAHCSNTFFFYSFMNITVQFNSFIFILRFDNFAWNCEIGTLLNFRGNIIYASSFLILVKNFTYDAIHLVHILITYLLT
jgi:hypothetical protein